MERDFHRGIRLDQTDGLSVLSGIEREAGLRVRLLGARNENEAALIFNRNTRIIGLGSVRKNDATITAFFRSGVPDFPFFTGYGATCFFWWNAVKMAIFSVLLSNPIRKTFFCTPSRSALCFTLNYSSPQPDV